MQDIYTHTHRGAGKMCSLVVRGERAELNLPWYTSEINNPLSQGFLHDKARYLVQVMLTFSGPVERVLDL